MREGHCPSQFATPFHGQRNPRSQILIVAGEGVATRRVCRGWGCD
jgi:hypothetical protein